MAGFHHGDPYYPANGANGWIEEEEEEEPMEIEEEEPETESEDEEPLDMIQPEELLDEESDEGSDEEINVGEVINEPHPVRSRELPLPPPAFQDQQPPPRWAAQLHGWSRELGLRPPYGMSQAYFDLSEGTSADRALPVMVGQMSHLDVQTRAIRGQLADIGAEARVTAVRVRRMDEQQDHHHDIIETLRRDHAAVAARMLSYEERMVAVEQRAIAAETRAASAETRVIAAETRATEAEQRADTISRDDVDLADHLASHYGYDRTRLE